MPDTMFLLITLFAVGMILMIGGQGFLMFMNRSDLYSQDRYDKAFREIIKNELRLERAQRRQKMLTSED